MALTTYSELKAAIANRLHRSDLTANIVDYITIAEKRLNRSIRLVAQETEASLTASVGSRTMTLPSLFGTPLALYLTTYPPRVEVEYRLPTEMQYFSDNGYPDYWTIDGASISLDKPADQGYTFKLRYTSDYNLAVTSTNSLLTNYPDLYLYGSLIEAASDLADDKLYASSKSRYEEALQECLNNEGGVRSIAYLTTEFGNSNRQNIITGS